MNRQEFFNVFPKLETKRFYLEPLNETYLKDLVQMLSDKDVMKYEEADIVDPEKMANLYLNKVKTLYENKKGIRWAVINKSNHEFVGDIGLYNIDFFSNHTEIGYTIRKEYWRKGVASECIKQVLEFSFNKLDMNKVIAKIDQKNSASIQLSEKLNFHLDGILREEYYTPKSNGYLTICIYSMLKREFEV